MKLSPFLLDQWLESKNKFPIEYDLASSTGPHWTLQELLQIMDPDRQKAMFDRALGYSDPAGNPELRAAVAKFYGVQAEDVQIMTGASEGLLVLFFLAAEPKSNVVLPFPGFPPFAELARSFGLEVRFYHLKPENQFAISTDEIQSLTDIHTRMILINSPHNPAGSVIGSEDLIELHDFCTERKIQLVVDEVYHPLYWEGGQRPSAAQLPNATFLSDLSKALCFSGLRIGWIIDRNHERSEAYLNARSYFTISNSPLTEMLATVVMEHSDTVLGKASKVAGSNRGILESFFSENEEHVRWVRPEGGTISFPWLVSGKNSRPFCEAMRAEGILLAPGDCFGMESHFRLGFGACSWDIRPALRKMAHKLRAY